MATTSVALGDDADEAGNLSGSISVSFDRDAGDALDAAVAEIDSGRLSSGLNRLQHLLDDDANSLIPRRGSYVHLGEAVNHVIAELSAAQIETYNSLFNDRAQAALTAALNPMHPDGLRRLTDQYRYTRAGQQAAGILAALAFDRGDERSAVAWIEFLDENGSAASDSRLWRALKDRLSRATGNHVDFEVEKAAQRAPQPDDAPSWTIEFGVDPRASQLIGAGVAEMDAQGFTPLMTARPLIHGQSLVTRTLFGLICVDTSDGSIRWQHRSDSRVAQLAAGSSELSNLLLRREAAATMLRKHIRNSLSDHLSTDGERVYAIVAVVREQDPQNSLQALDLNTGETAWEHGPSRTEYFMGPPLVVGDMLYILSQRRTTIQLIAMEPTTGKRQWTVPLGRAVRNLDVDRERQHTACHLSQQGNRILCPTAAGGIVSVDTLKQRVEWVCRYPRIDLPRTTQKADDDHYGEIPIRQTWLDARVWQRGEIALSTAPEANRLFAIDSGTGQVLWSKHRGGGLQVLHVDSRQVEILGRASLQSLDVTTGEQRWERSITRPAGTAIVRGDEILVPLANGRCLSVNRVDGAPTDPSDAVSHLSERDSDIDFEIAAHPPTGRRPVFLRHLVSTHGRLYEQSSTGLMSLGAVCSLAESSSHDSFHLDLRPLAEGRTVALPWLAHARRIDSRLLLADSVVLSLLDRSGLRQTPADQIRQSVSQLLTDRETGTAATLQAAAQKLAALSPDQYYITFDEGRWSSRLDRWLGDLHMAMRSAAEAVPDANSDCPSTDQSPDDAWPEGTPVPTVEDNNRGALRYVHVPLNATADSTWSDVTVAVDRTGKAVLFQTAGQKTVNILLPRESGASRMTWSFLRAWAVGEVLTLRVGRELMTFRRSPDGPLPTTSQWPTDNETMPLQELRFATSDFELPREAIEDWHDSSPGVEDVFGRRLAEVGPVRANYLCYQQQGHVIAVAPDTGAELWRRSGNAVGTRVIGDDAHVALFREGDPTVTVLDAVSGRTVRTWEADEGTNALTVHATSILHPQIISGTIALGVRSTESETTITARDFSTGDILWSLSAHALAQVIGWDECTWALIEPPLDETSSGRMRRLNWRTGQSLSDMEVQVPADLRAVYQFADRDTRYLITSTEVTDPELLQVRQIRDGFRRPPVNGWLTALARHTGELRFEHRLENVAFPLDQPRHVPLLIINDVIQTAQSKSPTGRLQCLDRRTGEVLWSTTVPSHAYFSVQADHAAGRIDLELDRQRVSLKFAAARSANP